MSNEQLRRVARTRLSNGSSQFLGPVDGRTVVAKRFSELVFSHMADLGGEAHCSEAEKAIIRRACTLIVILETIEAKFAADGSITAKALDDFGRHANTLRRLLETVGLKRRSRDVTPPKLTEYIEARAKGGPRRVARQ